MADLECFVAAERSHRLKEDQIRLAEDGCVEATCQFNTEKFN